MVLCKSKLDLIVAIAHYPEQKQTNAAGGIVRTMHSFQMQGNLICYYYAKSLMKYHSLLLPDKLFLSRGE